MVYSKANLKSDGDKAYPCFKTSLTENMPDKCLPTRTQLYVSFLLALPVSWGYQSQ